MALETYESFDKVKVRLDEIVDAVGSDDLPLDDALALYEEAVSLGLRASDLLEANIEEHDLQDEACNAANEEEAAEQDEISEGVALEQAPGSSFGIEVASPSATGETHTSVTA